MFVELEFSAMEERKSRRETGGWWGEGSGALGRDGVAAGEDSLKWRRGSTDPQGVIKGEPLGDQRKHVYSSENKAQPPAGCACGRNRVNEAGIREDGVGEVTVARSRKALVCEAIEGFEKSIVI